MPSVGTECMWYRDIFKGKTPTHEIKINKSKYLKGEKRKREKEREGGRRRGREIRSQKEMYRDKSNHENFEARIKLFCPKLLAFR